MLLAPGRYSLAGCAGDGEGFFTRNGGKQMNAADTAWMLASTALVLLMTPALGFFYGGLVRAKNSLNTIMMSVAALGFVGVAWALIAYSFAFAPGSGFIGAPSFAFLR